MKFYELKRRKPSREKEATGPEAAGGGRSGSGGGCAEEAAGSGRGLEAGSGEGACCDSSSDEADPGKHEILKNRFFSTPNKQK